jgi:dihydropteroate synthase
MGVLNVTPDSFWDGGEHARPGDAVERAREMAEEGADLVDVGGESTRPGAPAVDAEEEWARIGPVLEELDGGPVPLSVDTTKSEVAARALEAGAAVLNDVSGLRFDPGLADLAARHGAGLVLMHMRGTPRTMQEDTEYDDLLGEVTAFLADAAAEAGRRGCRREQLVVDPGIGFGKSARGSLELLGRLGEIAEAGLPVLVGVSRKSFIGDTLGGLPAGERLEGTLAACVAALDRGARIFRVHDVRAARRALDLAEAVRRAGAPRAAASAGGER